ncbi:hypothetical protein BTA05_06255 [Enterococcus faecium]|nr:hypothetical protein BTA05_06255 [Enterococcus faecium]
MFSAKNIVLLTEINGFFDASLLHNYMDVIKRFYLKIISSGYFKDFIVIDTKWNKKDIENILNSRNN